MKWQGHRQSENVEDRRGQGVGGRGLPIGGRGIGLGTVVVALVAGWIFGINPLTMLGLLGGGGEVPAVEQGPTPRPPEGDVQAAFVSTVLADTEDVWRALFRSANATYEEPRLVLFRGAVPTACGRGESAAGPFYCPADRKVYLDLGFFDTLRERLGAPGDFAQAYVIAHEVGHHVQQLAGSSRQLEAAVGRGAPPSARNEVSVRIELQADCLAGVWTHHSQRGKGWLEATDLEEAMNAAARIGDDTLQRSQSGRVVPESFTHGTSEQRMRWFRRGQQSGVPADCNSTDPRTPL